MIRSRSISSASIRELTTAGDIRAAQQLRYKVWRSEGALIARSELGIMTDKHDDHAIHWGAFHDGRLVGSARLCMHENLRDAPDGELFSSTNLPTPIASMNRLIVLDTHRGNGIGAKFDELRLARARQIGAAAIIVAPVAGLLRRQSLEKRGFQFLEGVMGHAIWSPTVSICACYLMLGTTENLHD
jgi:GNAT superfamily N-acetyltransferase